MLAIVVKFDQIWTSVYAILFADVAVVHAASRTFVLYIVNVGISCLVVKLESMNLLMSLTSHLCVATAIEKRHKIGGMSSK